MYTDVFGRVGAECLVMGYGSLENLLVEEGACCYGIVFGEDSVGCCVKQVLEPPSDVLFCVDTYWSKPLIGRCNDDVFISFDVGEQFLLEKC